jgi:hypothetical protein
MQEKKLDFVTKVYSRFQKVKNLSSLAEMADYLDIRRSTLRNRKSRNSIPYEEIVSKLSAPEYAYVFKNDESLLKETEEARNASYNSDVEKSSEIWPNDPVLKEFEQRVDEIVDLIMHGPFSRGLKIQLVKSLLRKVDQERDELHKQSDPSHPVSSES